MVAEPPAEEVKTDPSAFEIAEALTAALARQGLAGRVVVRGDVAELRGKGAPVAVELGDWPKQWPLLPPDIRERKVTAAVRRLLEAARGRALPDPAHQRYLRRRLRSIAATAATLVMVGGVIFWLRQKSFFGVPTEPTNSSAMASPSNASQRELPEQRSARIARSCEAARGRLRVGGSLAGFDLGGWQAVLWLARDDGSGSWASTLERQARDGSLTKDLRAALTLPTGTAELRLERAGQGDSRLAPSSLALHLDGNYAEAFFNPEGRDKLSDWSAGLAKAEAADLGALYATCLEPSVHDVGAWYWGRDDGHAVAALVYAAGALADPPIAELARPRAPQAILSSLVSASGELPREALGEVVAAHGGTVERAPPPPSSKADAGAGPASYTIVRFPIGGPTRAGMAARALFARLAPGLSPGPALSADAGKR